MIAGTSSIVAWDPYTYLDPSPNVVWQDTTSNATYASAENLLTIT